jgi:hypothetical protein
LLKHDNVWFGKWRKSKQIINDAIWLLFILFFILCHALFWMLVGVGWGVGGEERQKAEKEALHILLLSLLV